MPPLTMQEEGLTKGTRYVMCLFSRSHMCLGWHCRGHSVHLSRVGRCPHMCPWVGPHVLSFGQQLLGGCPAVWSISHHRGYWSCQSTLQSPHLCCLSYGVPLLAGNTHPIGFTQWRSKPLQSMEIQASSHNIVQSRLTEWRSKLTHTMGIPDSLHKGYLKPLTQCKSEDSSHHGHPRELTQWRSQE